MNLRAAAHPAAMPANPPAFIIRAPRTENEWAAYFDARWRWLRAPLGLPRGSERAESDADAIHRAAFETSGAAEGSPPRILAVGCLHPVEVSMGRVRFVATDPDLRRSGVGRALMHCLEEAARKHSLTTLILHAREEAVAFYERLGYATVGPLPPAVADIPHFYMRKILSLAVL